MGRAHRKDTRDPGLGVWPAKDLGELSSDPSGEWSRLAGRPGGRAHVGRWSS
jgi:hypothetical protein